MNYLSFCETLKQSLLLRLAPETTVSAQKLRKNNGILLDACCIRIPGSACSPLVCLDPLYEDFKSGSSISEICESILSCLDSRPPFSDGLFEKLRDFDSARDRIAFRLISKESNRELLSEIPWVPYLDLALIFYLYLESSETGQTTALIHNRQLELWNKSTEDLYLLSLINTPVLFPPVLQELEELLYGSPREDGISLEELAPASAESPLPLYVLTNRPGIHGASCMLYHDIIKDFADRINSDIIIIPSSIHEVLLIPDNAACNYQKIQEMIQKINSEDVPAEDRLSDQLYLFSRKQKHLTIWSPDGSPSTPEPA